MSLPPVRLIATDLDGTLLRWDGTVSERMIASIQAARASGIEIVPATGRPRIITTDVIAQLPFLDHWIFANGSVTWHEGRSELIRGFWLEAELARSLITKLRSALPEVGFAVEFELDVAYEEGFEAVVPQAPTEPPVTDLLAVVKQRVQKLLVFDLSRSVEDLYAIVSDVVGNDGVPSYSGLEFIELAATEVTKATAVELLAADLGIERDEVAAFGDNHNDVAMLRWAPRSYAMAHATDDAVAAARQTIGSNEEDAVALMVDELVEERR